MANNITRRGDKYAHVAGSYIGFCGPKTEHKKRFDLLCFDKKIIITYIWISLYYGIQFSITRTTMVI